MAPRAQLSIPSTESLPHAFRLPANNREVVRTMNKLARKTLIDLALFWLRKKNRQFAPAYLYSDHDPDFDEVDAPYDPAHDYEELHDIYKEFATRKGGKRDVVDRILEGDWRSGVSLFQLATAEIQHLVDHSNALRWNAKRIAKIESTKPRPQNIEVTNTSEHLPRFHGQTFLLNLRREVSPLLKAHYYLGRVDGWPITILRVYVHDSPYATEASLKTAPEARGTSDSSKAVFFVFPDGSPYVYVSLSTHFGQTVGPEARQLRDILLQAVPKALSRPSNRYELQNTNLSARDLNTLLKFRGPGRTNAAAGGWSIFAENSFSQSALDYAIAQRLKGKDTEQSKSKSQTDTGKENTTPPPKPTASRGRPKRKISVSEAPSPAAKRQKEVAEGRFGVSGTVDDGLAMERFEVRIDDPFPGSEGDAVGQAASAAGSDGSGANIQNAQVSKRTRKGRQSLLDKSLEDIDATDPDGSSIQNSESWVPDVRVAFQGAHVFAGIRELVEQGVVDGEKMPGWMTGEAGVSVGAVKEGRVRTKGGVPGV
ncbi:CHL4 family chromosome segregation protein-like protein [Delitschia confertaspora ATCC 74209]|uniref:CHL4 family chromosome segregation protein-like protein n=1 Tax=Delitschia confertaspora ATCC 74209 TaxID=1513339 RepID=A0A9P4JNG5_9PLEO|nr:CHL4 family chromosome segregation protein-like protein [Delitschia confertaspora ATCC 74209]